MDKIIIEYKEHHSFRERMLLWLLGVTISIHAKFYFRRKKWGLSTNELLQYPTDTLGKRLGLFLQTEKLEPVDKVERHDAFHILFEFTTNIRDEAAMQFFLVGNGKVSPFTIGTALFAGLMLPEYWSRFYHEFHKGRKVKPIAYWDFEALLDFQFADVQDYIYHRSINNTRMKDIIHSFNRTSLRG